MNIMYNVKIGFFFKKWNQSHFWAYTGFECEVMGMSEPIRMKNNGQISIMLNVNKREKIKVQNKAIPSKPLSHEHAVLNEIEKEMNTLVGMDQIKKMMKEVYAWIYINKKREEAGLKAGQQVLHMMFKG